jgi:hypothetical protein
VQCSNGSEIKIIVYENDYEHCMQCAFTTENCDKKVLPVQGINTRLLCELLSFYA